MDIYSGHINRLIEELSRLPGVGAKSAQRLAFHIINMPESEVNRLADTMIDAKQHIHYCKECFTLTDEELCPICRDQKRDHKTIMVVEHTRDMAAYEKTGKYEGVYHVLHGAISPMLGIGPADIRLKELMVRLQGDVDEVIIATNSNLEGETTAMYISKMIKPTGIKVTRIASGNKLVIQYQVGNSSDTRKMGILLNEDKLLVWNFNENKSKSKFYIIDKDSTEICDQDKYIGSNTDDINEKFQEVLNYLQDKFNKENSNAKP